MGYWRSVCVVLFACQVGVALSQNCRAGSCNTGDLLIGREHRLTASSTCGMERPETFCIVSHLQEEEKCFDCDSRDPYAKGPNGNPLSHRIENIVTTFSPHNDLMWWQSANGIQEVYIQFDLEAIFHFTHLIMTFRTFRPRAMLIERSADFGRTWSIYRYFAYDCEDAFPGVPTGPLREINDVICESRYSSVEPSTEGEVVFRVLPPHIQIKDPYSDEVQGMIKITNLRINFTQLHTLGDIELDNRPLIRQKYYYAVKDMVVRGSCHCYGHASSCVSDPDSGRGGVRVLPTLDPRDRDRKMYGADSIVHGKCQCTHNTEGNNCERCRPFFNDRPWRPWPTIASTLPEDQQTQYECKTCNCNQHSYTCHFDPAVWEQTNEVSGGVCDDCQHNTMGRNCHECKPFFYANPALDIRDEAICVACDCDPYGSEHGGECESRTDPADDLVAGRCICKRLVEGDRCDTCVDGYWNLRDDNPEGCEECSCDTLGTEGNRGCDKSSGNCICKRFVTGRNCDTCYEGYFGLSEEAYGCKYCDCDPGGAFNNSCSRQSGQCYCRTAIEGRRCDMVRSGYFYQYMDFFTYEAEESTFITDPLIELEPRRRDNDYISWTGPGFIRIREGGSIEYTIDDVVLSGEYDVILRYEPLLPGSWNDVRVTVTRPDAEIPTQSVCGNTIPQDDLLATSLPSGSRSRTLSAPICLEKGKTYTIRIDFNRYSNEGPLPEAQILVDSLVLIPRATSFEMFQGSDSIKDYRREQWEYYRCAEAFEMAVHAPVSEVCEDLIFSMSAIAHDGALDCDCDPTGSKSNICDEFGGQCECKENVIGRRCDQCAPGTYGFGPNGCSLCACSNEGSISAFCDVNSGQCQCIPNAYGRGCDECQSGFWNFPNCRRCECNGHAERCESATSICIDCRDFTTGDHCERCENGYYGDPILGSGIACQPCMCPGGSGSGYQFADTCQLDQTTQTVYCNCERGYTGIRCDSCDNNYFGNPVVPGGFCESCNCNNNIDTSSPGNCNAQSGQCLQCLYNTAGYNCEECKPGYFGDALQRSCRQCGCNLLGTDMSRCDLNNNCGVCDRFTGQCPCLPNVLGDKCNQCEVDHWKLASGTGCEACGCCPFGALSSQCNEFTGQCQCRPKFGGRTCCDCEELHYGDPLVECLLCDCDPDGSETLQCERGGQCVCKPGVTGRRCDMCARGTTGSLPYCEPCGECFDNWDAIIMDLQNQTDYLIDSAKNLKHTGASAAYDAEFDRLEAKLAEAQALIRDPSVSEDDMNQLMREYDDIRTQLEEYSRQLDVINVGLSGTQVSTFRVNRELDRLQIEADDLQAELDDFKTQSIDVESANVEGAFKSILESQNRSKTAQDRVDGSGDVVAQSAEIRQIVEDLIAQKEAELGAEQDQYENRLEDVDNQLTGLEGRLAGLNEQVCGIPGDSCGSCGGAGCGFCGGLGCNGAKTQSDTALGRATAADDLLNNKEQEANSILEEMGGVREDTKAALDAAQMAYDDALQAKIEAEGAQTNLTDLINAIQDFLSTPTARPADIKAVVDATKEIEISLSEQEIQDLAKEIEDTVASLENIDQILNDTADDLRDVQALKKRADMAKEFADEVLASAENVIQALEDAEAAQDSADAAVKAANDAIEEAEDDLVQIESEAGAALEKANGTLEKVGGMDDKLNNVQRLFTNNVENVRQAGDFADMAQEEADGAYEAAQALLAKFNQTSDQVMNRSAEAQESRRKAEELREDVLAFEKNATEKLQELEAMKTTFVTNENTLTDLSDEIDALNKEMTMLLLDIQERAQKYRDCRE